MSDSQSRLQRAMRLVGETPGASNPRKTKSDEPTVAERLKWLGDYLKIDADPYDFTYLVSDYYEWLGEDPPEAFDADDPHDFFETDDGKAVEKDFVKWLTSEGLDQFEVANDAHAPAYLHFQVRGDAPADTWLVHFSDEAAGIARDGFLHGHPDERTLGLTTWFVDSVRKAEAGWNFGFRATSGDANNAAYNRKYGRDAVLFQAPGVRAYHWGDEEEQVIFWGPSAKRFIPLHRDSDRDGWYVADTKTGEPVREGTFREVVAWATDHFDDRGVKIVVKTRKAKAA